MKLNKKEIAVIRCVVNSDVVVFAISPRLWREMRRVKKCGDGYEYGPDDGVLSICLDFYPGRRTAAEKRNQVKP